MLRLEFLKESATIRCLSHREVNRPSVALPTRGEGMKIRVHSKKPFALTYR